MKGLFFSVKKYSVHDGPGIRVTFFMKGCPMSCLWCHNPEGISPFPQAVVQTRKIGLMEFSQTEDAGKYYSVEDVLDILEEETVFIKQSGGGVTFSGGEPMLQHEFLLEALKACKSKGFNTTVDTSGYSPAENFRSIIPFTDLFLFDIKHLDDKKHTEFTGVSNKQIMENYRLLLGSCNSIIIRIPVIPGYNDDPEHLEKLKQLLSETKNETVKKICLLPFHKTGSSKYKKLNIPYRMINVKPPSTERMKELKHFFSETGIKVKIGG
jgi:pyruvate formate lyase activating enzyme